MASSQTRHFLFESDEARAGRAPREPEDWLRLRGVTRNNVHDLEIAFPKGCLLYTSRCV